MCGLGFISKGKDDMKDQTAKPSAHQRGWIAAALCGLAMVWPAQALADDEVFDGPVFWSESGVSPLLDQAQNCGLDAGALSVSQEIYEMSPLTDADRAAMDVRLAAIGDLAGFGDDPAQRSVSRAFLRKVLTSRMLLTLTYEVSGRQAGMACLGRWLAQEGFRRVRADEADALRAGQTQ
jgi:hypothetical protein